MHTSTLNARYLKAILSELPSVLPYEGTTRMLFPDAHSACTAQVKSVHNTVDLLVALCRICIPHFSQSLLFLLESQRQWYLRVIGHFSFHYFILISALHRATYSCVLSFSILSIFFIFLLTGLSFRRSHQMNDNVTCQLIPRVPALGRITSHV